MGPARRALGGVHGAPPSDDHNRAVELTDALADLVDHHCHGLVLADLDRAQVETLLNEAQRPPAPGRTRFDSMLGVAVRRHCGPVLGVDPGAPVEEYLATRGRLGGHAASELLVGAAGVGTFLVDTGIRDDRLTDPDGLARLAGGVAREVVRLERLAEDLLADGEPDVVAALPQRLASCGAVAAKSIAAYRVGLELPDRKPSEDDVRAALADLDRTPDGSVRLADPVVSGWLAWTAVEAGLPLQVHAGYGDADLDLRRADPLLLTPFLRATREHGTPVVLLHCYPFHRHAAYLAQVLDHVHVDLGLATHNTGAFAATLLRETLELVPFDRLLFSTDAYGLAEHVLLGATLFRAAATEVLAALVACGEMTPPDALRVAGMVGSANAREVYSLSRAA
jgi:hypothetical protein